MQKSMFIAPLPSFTGWSREHSLLPEKANPTSVLQDPFPENLIGLIILLFSHIVNLSQLDPFLQPANKQMCHSPQKSNKTKPLHCLHIPKSPSQANFWTVVRDHLYSSPYVSLSFHYNLASFPLLTKIVLVNVTIDVQGVKCKGNFQGQLT